MGGVVLKCLVPSGIHPERLVGASDEIFVRGTQYARQVNVVREDTSSPSTAAKSRQLGEKKSTKPLY